MKTRRSLGVVGIVLAAALVAACGGDGGETTPSITLGITLPTTVPTGLFSATAVADRLRTVGVSLTLVTVMAKTLSKDRPP